MAVLVVGGRGGIGRAVVDRLTVDGNEVVVLDAVDGHDAADPDAVEEFLTEHRTLTGLVHLAGVTGAGSLQDHDLDMWHRVLDANLTSAFVVLQQVVPRLEPGSGIVLCSSVNGRTGGNELSGPAYAAAKAGIIALTRHVATHQAHRGIRANAIAPGPVATPMVERLTEAELRDLLATIPLGRVTPPAEIADLVAFLLSDRAASITGATMDVNGGAWMS